MEFSSEHVGPRTETPQNKTREQRQLIRLVEKTEQALSKGKIVSTWKLIVRKETRRVEILIITKLTFIIKFLFNFVKFSFN